MMRRAFAVAGVLVAVACGGSSTVDTTKEPTDHSVVDGGDCRSDLQCISGACFPSDLALGCGKCGPRVATGSCYSDAHCTVETHCAFSDYYVGTCANDAAGTPAPGCPSACAAGSVCYGNTCRTLGKAGELCAPSGDVNTCEAGLICSPFAKTCETPRPIIECRPAR